MIHWPQSLVFLSIMMKFFVVYEYEKNSFLHFSLQCLMWYEPFPLKNLQFVIIIFFCWTILVGDLSIFHGLFSQQELRDNCLDRSKDYIEVQLFLSWGWLLKVHFSLAFIRKQNSHWRFVWKPVRLLIGFHFNFNHKPRFSFCRFISFISNVCMNLPLCCLTKGGLQSGKPQPSVIIPSAAFGGVVISFVLCSSELVKVSKSQSLCTAIFFPTSCL